MIKVPEVIAAASGIKIFGKLIKSLVFTTDVAIIKNCNANAVIAVYPFTPQPAISHAIIHVSDVPVFCGVGGGITGGKRSINLALDAENQGALGVVLNAPATNATISRMRDRIDIPIIVTVASEKTDFAERIKAGASILNVSGASNTINIVKKIRQELPDAAVIATGGPNDDTVRATIEAGANAITFTPPTPGEILKRIMSNYRNEDHII
jgi:hypothetical protein